MLATVYELNLPNAIVRRKGAVALLATPAQNLYTSAVKPLIVNVALARRIELAEAQAAVDCAQTLARMRPDSGATFEKIAGGFAVYCGADSPTTQAVGLGLSGPVSKEEFARLEEFYRDRKEPVRVETCPLADASLIEHFGRGGYRVTEFSNVMARSLGGDAAQSAEDAPLPTGVIIERAGANDLDLWTRTVSQGFSESYAVTQELLEAMKMFALGPDVECYLARVDGEIAGGGTLARHDGVAGLFGASTLPAFRNRGVQTALLSTRLRRASELGCDMAVSLAQAGSASQRNIMRQNFSVLYTRVKFEKIW